MTRKRLDYENRQIGRLRIGQRIEHDPRKQARYLYLCLDCGHKGEMEVRRMVKGCQACGLQRSTHEPVFVVLEDKILTRTVLNLLVDNRRYKGARFYFRDQRVQVHEQEADIYVSQPPLRGVAQYLIFDKLTQDLEGMNIASSDPYPDLQAVEAGKQRELQAEVVEPRVEHVLKPEYEAPAGWLMLKSGDEMLLREDADSRMPIPPYLKAWLDMNPKSDYRTVPVNGVWYAAATVRPPMQDVFGLDDTDDSSPNPFAKPNTSVLILSKKPEESSEPRKPQMPLHIFTPDGVDTGKTINPATLQETTAEPVDKLFIDPAALARVAASNAEYEAEEAAFKAQQAEKAALRALPPKPRLTPQQEFERIVSRFPPPSDS